jgi:hypothetical protein
VNKKIFLGIIDIASQIQLYKSGYEKLGLQVTTCSPSMINSKYSSDITYERFLNKTCLIDLRHKLNKISDKYHKYFFSRIIIIIFGQILNISKRVSWFFFIHKFDMFHFMWVNDIVDSDFEWRLRMIKKRNKKVIFCFVGDDIRWRPLLIEELLDADLDIIKDKNEFLCDYIHKTDKELNKSFRRKVNLIRVVERYSDLILSGPDLAQLQVKPYDYFYVPVDLKKYNRKSTEKLDNRKTKTLKVIHASTSRNAKGTNLLISKINSFKRNNRYGALVEFDVVEGMPHEELLNLLPTYDIAIYSIIGMGPGKFGIEALLNGLVLLTGNNYKYTQYPEDLIFNINYENFEEILNHVIENFEEIQKDKNRRIERVKDLHDVDKLCKNYLDILFFDSKVNRHIVIPKFLEARNSKLTISELVLEEFNGVISEYDYLVKKS